MGDFFVSCCLQTGQGLVITYVMTLRLLWKPLFCVIARLLPQGLFYLFKSGEWLRLCKAHVRNNQGMHELPTNATTRTQSC